MTEWHCAGCGIPVQNLVKRCDCLTMVACKDGHRSVWMIDQNRDEPKWKKIETAPNDGTDVLVACGERVWVSSRKKGKCVGGLPTGWDWIQPTASERPTHWMPLPEAPK